MRRPNVSLPLSLLCTALLGCTADPDASGTAENPGGTETGAATSPDDDGMTTAPSSGTMTGPGALSGSTTSSGSDSDSDLDSDSTDADDTTGGPTDDSDSTSSASDDDTGTSPATDGETGESSTGEPLEPFDYCPALFVDVWPDRTRVQASFTDGCGGTPIEHPAGERVIVRVDGSEGEDLLEEDLNGTATFSGEVDTLAATQIEIVVVRPDDSEHAALFDLPARMVVTSPEPEDRLPQGEAFGFSWETGDGPFIGWHFNWEYVDDDGMTVSSPPSGEGLPDEEVGSGTVYAYFTEHDAPHDVDAVLSLQREAYGTMTLGETYPGGFSIVTARIEVPVVLTPPNP